MFIEKLSDAIHQKTLLKLILSNPNPESRIQYPESSIPPSRSTITLVAFKTGFRLNFVLRYPTNDITKNYPVEEGLKLIRDAIGNPYLNADLFSSGETIQLAITGKGKGKLTVKKTGQPVQPTFHHDHVKTRMIETSGNLYLHALGVLNADFGIRREMADKFVQINRYIELLDPHIRQLSKKKDLYIADMGAGKGYLTFALYDFLRKTGWNPHITGVESRGELVADSNEIALKAGFSNLEFIQGTIRDAKLEKIDILIALHACDTATDDAISRGINAGASLIVVAPCCHKQMRKVMTAPEVLKPLYKYGVLEERQAEILTDAIRALIMEAFGYKTTMTEFTDSGHTPKNIMIIGRKSPGKVIDPGTYMARIHDLRNQFGAGRHYLEEAMGLVD